MFELSQAGAFRGEAESRNGRMLSDNLRRIRSSSSYACHQSVGLLRYIFMLSPVRCRRAAKAVPSLAPSLESGFSSGTLLGLPGYFAAYFSSITKEAGAARLLSLVQRV